jgi:thiol-disulfide isomerase/thioredoxin
MIRWSCAAAVFALLARLGDASAASLPDEAEFLRDIGVSDPAQVTYLDARKHRIQYSDIEKQMARGATFSVEKSENGAVLVQVETAARKKAAVPKIKMLPGIGLKDLDSNPISAVDPSNKYSLLVFYFAKCAPCIQEVPTLNRFAALHPEINNLAITFDSRPIARQFSKTYNFGWRVAADASNYMSAAGVTACPTLIVADAKGNILARKSGGSLGDEPAAQLASLEAFVDGAVAR